MGQATIKDIAKQLELSVSTVSRALRDHPDIADRTKKRVMDLAREMDYQPNTLAQSLQARTSRTIGIIVPEIQHHFFSSAISAIEKVANKAGYFVMFCQTDESYEQEVLNTRAFMEHRVAGLIVSISQETRDFEHFRMVMRRNVPIVFFDRAPEELDASKVVVDDYGGAYKITSHFIERGYRRIAHIAGPNTISIGRERHRGYRDALEAHGFSYDPDLVVTVGFRENDGVGAMQELLNKGQTVDAVFCVNDPVAVGAFQFLRERGVAIPSEIALGGFSNNPITSLIDPPLTTVEQPVGELGKMATHLLLDQIRSEDDVPPVITKHLRTRLVVREST